MSDAPSLLDIVEMHTLCALDDVIEEFDVDEEPIAKRAIVKTLDCIQTQFYLLPKLQVIDDGSIVPRSAPDDVVSNEISKLWDNVSD